MQKAHDAFSGEELEPLMGKTHSELMSSHIHKLMQVCALVSFSYAHLCFLLSSSLSLSFFFFF